MFSDQILQAADDLIQRCLDRDIRLVLAESCTGGLITGAITSIPGASRVLDRAYGRYGRSCTMDVMELPDDVPVLVGQLPLEHLDLVMDLRSRSLIGNPAHGGEHVYELY